MEADLSYFLELRLRVRGNAEATAIIDRCLRLIARAQAADPKSYERIEIEVLQLADDLALRFGAPKTAVLQ
jgi:hypothetical protein